MADILLLIFKDRPEVINFYYKYRSVLISTLLLCTLTTALLANNDKLRSLSLGFAIGIVIVNIGESVSRLRITENKKLRTGNESVNG